MSLNYLSFKVALEINNKHDKHISYAKHKAACVTDLVCIVKQRTPSPL